MRKGQEGKESGWERVRGREGDRDNILIEKGREG